MTFDMMDDSPTSAGRDLPVAAVALSALVGAMVAVLCGGCLGNKASHQNGIVAYVSASGPSVGLGYGETEDLPGGCVYYRDVESSAPAFWGGTNYTRTITIWDTRWMGMTPAAPRARTFTCGWMANGLQSAAREPETPTEEPPSDPADQPTNR